MADTTAGRFPDPHEFQVPPELEGWEEMYPSHHLFSKDRAEWEKAQFWYQDKIHAPEPMPPLDLIFQEAWQIALSQYTTRVFCIPPAQGIAQRMLGCYMYICAIPPPPEQVIGEKAQLFEKRVFYVFDHYDELWEKWLTKFKVLGNQMAEVSIPEQLPKFVPDNEVLPAPKGFYCSYDIIEAFDRLVNRCSRAGSIILKCSIQYLAYLMFADVSRKLSPGSVKAPSAKWSPVPMCPCSGRRRNCVVSQGWRPQCGVADILKSDMSVNRKPRIEKIPDGKHWLEELRMPKIPGFTSPAAADGCTTREAG